MSAKACKMCGETKPLSQFHRNGSDYAGKPRHRPDCIACIRKNKNHDIDRAQIIAMWDAGASIRSCANAAGRHYGTIVNWLRAAGRNTASRGSGKDGRRGDPAAAAPIGAAASFAEVDAAIMRARLEAGMVDGRCRLSANPWPSQSSLAL